MKTADSPPRPSTDTEHRPLLGSPRERRRHARTPIREELRLLSLETMSVVYVITTDFSKAGLGFTSLTQLKLNEALVVPLYMGEKRMLFLARVRYTRWLKDRSYRVGVEFMDSLEATPGKECLPLQWHALALEDEGFTSRRVAKPAAPGQPDPLKGDSQGVPSANLNRGSSG